jgi:hypothetical protein
MSMKPAFVTDMTRAPRIKSCLEAWREVALPVDAVLGWEKDWYPAITAGTLTGLFMFVWYWDPTLISFLAFTGLFLTLADYIVPRIVAQFCGADSWTGAKEKRFDDVCGRIVAWVDAVEGAFNYCKELKSSKPVIHFFGTIGFLLSLAWVGNRINNFFLLYLLTVLVAFLPGLHRKGLLQKYFSQITLKISEVVQGAKKDGKKLE